MLLRQENTLKNRPRTVYLDVLRVISMFAVMMLHLAATGHKTAAAGSVPWIICRGYDFFARFAVPVFVMISGALFLNPEKPVTLRMMLRKCIKRLVLLYFVWSFGYAVFQSAREYALFSGAYFVSVVRKTATGHYHMWYLRLCGILYLITPLLRRITAEKTRLDVLILTVFVFGVLAELLQLPVPAGKYVGYLGCYCLGHRLHSMQISQKKVVALAFCGVVSMIAAFLLGEAAQAMDFVSREWMPWCVLYSVAVFLVFKNNSNWIERVPTMMTWIKRLASCSLGMYLIHPAINLLLSMAGFHALTFSPLICVPLCAVLVCGASFAVVSVMKKLPLVSRMV